MPLRLTQNAWTYALTVHDQGQVHPHLSFVVVPPFAQHTFCFEHRHAHFND